MRSRWRAVLVAVAVCSIAGCVSVPSSGPVRSLPVTQGAGSQAQQYAQIFTVPPGAGWDPSKIVQGFLAANVNFADQFQVARAYLTGAASRGWNPHWSATVLKEAPLVQETSLTHRGANATVTAVGNVQAGLSGSGNYAVPATPKTSGYNGTFKLVKVAGQWRISALPEGNQLLLTSAQFAEAYQLRNLYFASPGSNPASSSGGDNPLVPDPVYVPLTATATDLANGLVQELINPPADWLGSGATITGFPQGTTLLGDVTINGGTAAINLGGGAIQNADDKTLQLVSAQLMATLANSEQPQVEAIELYRNGKPVSGPDGSPVQQADSIDGYFPAPQKTFYYLCRLKAQHAGVCGRTGSTGHPDSVEDLGGLQPSSIAISSDLHHLAVLAGGQVYLGATGHPLAPKPVGGTITSLCWDANDYLWVASSAGVFMLRPGGGTPTMVPLKAGNGPPIAGPVTELQVAPDGVRVALILDGAVLGFGAIMTQASGHAGQLPQPQIIMSPFTVRQRGLQDVTWYDGNDVIALRQGSTLWEYPVNGGAPTLVSNEPNMTSVTADGVGGGAVIAGLSTGQMMYSESVTGSSLQLATGRSPVFPG